MKISRPLDCKDLFCSPLGKQVHTDNLRYRIWTPVLEEAALPYRPKIQTRQSFATTAFSAGEPPLWIAKAMGHSTAKMVIEVYGEYVQNAIAILYGSRLTALYNDN